MGKLKKLKVVVAREWWGYLFAILAVVIATAIKNVAQPNIIPTDVPITYILAIVPVAIFFGLGPSILVCVLSLLAYDYYFIPPLNQINLSNIQEAPIEAIFLLVGVIISLLSSNLRRKNQIATNEILIRKKAEAELTRYQQHLEELVKQRTSELQDTNVKLDQEIKVCKQVETDLRLSEQRWVTTLSSIGDAVVATDVQGRITFINPVAEGLTGWKVSEAVNQPIAAVFNIINEYTRLKAENPVDKVLQQGVICGLANHTLLIRKDSTELPIDDSASPIKTPDGTTLGVILVFRDITERKKAIEKLSTSKERYEILSEANGMLLAAANPESIVQTIAHKIMRHLNCDYFFNYIADSETGKLLLNAYAGIDAETARRFESKNHDVGICGCDSGERCLVISDLHSFGVQAYSCHPLKIGPKTIGTLSFGSRLRGAFNADELSLMKTVADQVSVAMERKLAEDRLAEAVQRLNAHMDNSPLAIIEFDPQFRVIRWSKEAEKVFGWSEKEILGRAISEMKWVYEEDVKKVEEVSEGFSKATEPVAVNINRNYRKDGSIIVCEWYNSSIYDSQGKLSSVFSQVLDVTNRKKAEEELRETRDYLDNLFTYANAPIIVWDPEFHITRFNHAFERLTGRVADQVLGKDLDILFPEDSRDHSMEHILNASLGLRMEVEEIPIQHKDGAVHTILWNSATIYSSDGKIPVATIAQGQDITERKRAEEAVQRYTLDLEDYRNHLEELVKERTAELQSLSYRLIIVQEEERRAISRELHDQTGQSLTVLNLMLAKAMRSPESAKADLQSATQMVREVLAQVRNLSTNLHPGMLEDLGLLPTLNWYINDFSKKTDINIAFEQQGLERKLSPDLNITVYRIIQEALTNIVRYAMVKEAKVVVKVEDHKLTIEVEDHGTGFDMQSYSQGVGLRGIRERVRALKGQLEISSFPGKGTKIKVELPLLENASDKNISRD